MGRIGGKGYGCSTDWTVLEYGVEVWGEERSGEERGEKGRGKIPKMNPRGREQNARVYG